MLTHGSLFAGFDGIGRGFERAGIKTIWRIELLDGKDIRGQDPLDYDRPDILSGGPPCVRTSAAARLQRRQTHETLWPELLRFAQVLKTTWIVVEQPASVDRTIILEWTQDLERCGYGVAGRVIDSKHWVPQQRARWFLIGRMGTTGLALWNHLYPDGNGVARREQNHGEDGKNQEIAPALQGGFFDGSCTDCVRGGVHARVSEGKPALMAAGNAVTEPVAEWIARRIIACQ